jgi:hypothetical protein
MCMRVAVFSLLSGMGVACAPPPSSTAPGGDAVASVKPPDPADTTRPAGTATPTAAATATPGGTTLFVAETLVDCQGEGPMKCMRIRTAADQPWSLHYDRIEGFTYEPSFAYELRVERREIPNPRADEPSFRYRLLEIVSKRKVEPAK